MATKAKATEKPSGEKFSCFVVCPIGSDASPERKHSNQVYKHIITPVLEAAGFDRPLRSDMISEGGNISRQIINHILEDDLVIADLTGKNPNVYYELAIRHCAAKPFIQLISVGETIPFDISQQRTIFFDRTDLDNVEATKVQLALHVEAAMVKGAKVDSPIGAALDFEKLRSGTDVERILSALVERIDTIDQRQRREQMNLFPRASAQGNLVLDEAHAMGIEIDPLEAANLEKRIRERLNHLRAEGTALDQSDVQEVVQDFIRAAYERLPGNPALNKIVGGNRAQRRAARRKG